MKKSILETVHDGVRDLHEIGVADEMTMRKFDALCLPEIRKYTPKQIAMIRKRAGASQAVFAAFLNISATTIQKWEQGQKEPSGPSLKLLSVVERKGLDALL